MSSTNTQSAEAKREKRLQTRTCIDQASTAPSQLLTETFRGSAQARPKQALHDTSYYVYYNICMVRPSRANRHRHCTALRGIFQKAA